MPKIGNKVINYSVYGKIEGKLKYLQDTSNCQLPSVETLSDTIKGAGIMGEIDFPSYCQVGSMVFTPGHRIDGEDAAVLFAPGMQEFEVRWVIDRLDSSNIQIGLDAHKAIIKGIPKKYDPGRVEAGTTQDGSNDYEVLYYKKIVNGKTILEIDKLNNVFKIAGVDYAAAIRAAL